MSVIDSTLHPCALDLLSKHFKFDRIFNLLDYDWQMDQLYHDLKPLVRSCYEDDYRFIFLFFDTEYYITNDQPGITLRNLQRILVSLDISNYFALIITQQDFDQHLQTLMKEETTDQCAIATIKTMMHQHLTAFDPLPVDLNANAITKHYQSLCRIRREHRSLAYSILKHEGLLDQGLVSYCAIKNERL